MRTAPKIAPDGWTVIDPAVFAEVIREMAEHNGWDLDRDTSGGGQGSLLQIDYEEDTAD